MSEHMFYEELEGKSHQLKRKDIDSKGHIVNIDVFPNTYAECVMFEDGDLLQEKFDKGELQGGPGPQGPPGPEPSIDHLEEKVDNFIDEMETSLQPVPQDIEDIIGIIGGL